MKYTILFTILTVRFGWGEGLTFMARYFGKYSNNTDNKDSYLFQCNSILKALIIKCYFLVKHSATQITERSFFKVCKVNNNLRKKV